MFTDALREKILSRSKLLVTQDILELNCVREFIKEFKPDKKLLMSFIYAKANGQDNIPKCKCGYFLKFQGKAKGYAETCGRKDCTYFRAWHTKLAKQGVLKKYGVENVSSLHQIVKKRKETNLVRYGVTTNLKLTSCKQKIKETNLKRYGGASSMCSPLIREKARKTCLRKYGTTNPAKACIIKSKIKATNLKRYGNTCSVHGTNQVFVDEIKKAKCIQKWFNIWSRKEYTVSPNFSVDEYVKKGQDAVYSWKCKICGKHFNAKISSNKYRAYLPICKHCVPPRTSLGEQELIRYISLIYKGTIKTNNRSLIKPYELDIVIPDLKIAIEYNGSYWHSLEAGKSDDYHLNKTKLCEACGYSLIHVSEATWIKKPEKIKRLLDNIINNKIPFKNKVIKVDRSIFNMNTLKLLGYKLLFEVEPKLKTDKFRGFHYYDCGKLVAIKGAKN